MVHGRADLKPLTTLRFFAAWWTVLYNYLPYLTPSPPAWTQRGTLGVDLFFVLSGFVLCHVYAERAGQGRLDVVDFFRARIARIYPLHLATLLAVGAMAAAAGLLGVTIDPRVASMDSLPANLLLVHAWGLSPVSGWNHASWSISSEWAAYLAFPVVAALVWRVRGRPWMAIGLALAFLVGIFLAFERLAGFPLTQATIRYGALRIAPTFLLGCAFWLAFRAGALQTARRAWAAAVASAAALAGLLMLNAPDVLVVATFPALILGLASLSRFNPAILSGRLGVYLGEISYSTYMLCIPWSLAFPHLWQALTGQSHALLPPFAWCVFILALLPLSALSHALIELPARRWVNGLGRMRRNRVHAETF